jgi:hypothetical protein
LIVPLLALFSFSVVAGASGFGTKPDYAGAVQDLTAAKQTAAPNAAPAVTASRDGGGVFVVVAASKQADKASPLANLEKKFTGREVCWITSSQLTRVASRYSTGRIDLSVDGKSLSIVTVSGANDHTLREYLGAPAVQCKLVEVAHVFFLPFDANGS